MFSILARRTASHLATAHAAGRLATTRPAPFCLAVRSVAANAAAAASSPPPRRRTAADKDPIILTERAAKRIHELLSNKRRAAAVEKEQAQLLGIRLGVRRRGCNGLSYTLNYVLENDESVHKDITMETHGVKLWIEPMALFNVVGTTMDWEETELSSEFTFSNPNSKGECGCGESFTV